MIYTPRTKSDCSVNPREEKPVRIASLPFDIPPATHDETAPPAPMIKGARDWRQDKELGLALWRAGR